MLPNTLSRPNRKKLAGGDKISAMFFVLLLSALVSAATEAKCPVFRPSENCKCMTLKDKSGDDFSTVTCRGLESEEALQRVLTATKGVEIFELELVDCAFRYLPHSGFVGTTIEVISIRNSSLHSLSDSSVAFEGLNNKLHLIEIINCSYASDWDWTQLSKLNQLMEIHVSESYLTDITDGLASIQHLDLEGFVFQKSHIHAVADNAFAPFFFLQRLSLDDNEIVSLKRSMFPNPAKKLQMLSLSYNKLSDLPDDLFENMPALRSLYLTGNPLHTVNEPTFRPIWNSLRLLLFYATRLSCDCRLVWLAKADNSGKYMHAECDGPSGFKGRLLSTLKPEELFC